MTIKIRGLFQKISKLKGLSLQVSFSNDDRTFEQTVKLTKKKKFKLLLDRDDLFNDKESAVLTSHSKTKTTLQATSKRTGSYMTLILMSKYSISQ